MKVKIPYPVNRFYHCNSCPVIGYYFYRRSNHHDYFRSDRQALTSIGGLFIQRQEIQCCFKTVRHELYYYRVKSRESFSMNFQLVLLLLTISLKLNGPISMLKRSYESYKSVNSKILMRIIC